MEDSPNVGSTDSGEYKVADMTDVIHSECEKKSQSRFFRRLQNLKRHHHMCEQRHEKAQTERLDDQRKKTLSLSQKNEQQSSSDSEGTLILEHTPADVEKDPNVPELRRTDSVILARQMHGYASDQSISSCQSSGDEYIPETSESKSEEEAEVTEKDSQLPGNGSPTTEEKRTQDFE
ncbi:mastermind-like protein 3 isoform X3 [Betta splendens]|uniref:Mastermind-like protein 3 isoform X3 n=1 Tax=Betta splendens TaxID=158456 RepID=A0A6P7MLL6_BETSP|nr:mastermind-like protein 3 isoform X3 [Betta splendens]